MNFDLLARTATGGRLPSSAPVLSSPDELFSASRDADPDGSREKSAAEEVIEKTYDVPGQMLAKHIRAQFNQARSERDSSGVTENIRKCVRLRRGEYTCEEKDMMGGPQTAIWFPLTERLCRTAVSFLRNVLNLTEHRLFDLTPTPVPDLPQDVKDQASDFLMDQLVQAAGAGVPTDAASVEAMVKAMKENLMAVMKDEARERSRAHVRLLDDQLTQAGWAVIMDAFIDDFVTYPSAVVVGPEVVSEPVAKWDNFKLKRTMQRTLRYRNVDPMNIYPSSDSNTPDDGAFVIEMFPMTKTQINDSRTLPGWMATHIDIMLSEHPNGFTEFSAHDSEHDENHDIGASPMARGTYDVLKMYGQVPGRFLIELGVNQDKAGHEVKADHMYESEVFILGDLPIHAILIDREYAARPIYMASMYNRAGSFWGESIPLTVETYQRTANATLRAMVRNMGFSSAPIFTVDDSVATASQGPTQDIIPGMTVHYNGIKNPNTSNGGVGIMQVAYHANVYYQSINTILEHAELQTGFPRYLLGAPASGGAARTLGGLSLLQSNAAIMLKSSIKNIDIGFIKKLLQWLYFFNLATSKDDSIKADSQIVVRGADYLLSKEINKARLTEALNTAMPFLQAGFVKSEGVAFLLRELFSDLGLDPDKIIIAPDRAAELQGELIQALKDVGGISGGGGGGGQQSSAQQSTAGQQATSQNQQPAQTQQVAA